MLGKMSVEFSHKVKLGVAMGFDKETYKLDSSGVKNFYDSFVAKDRDGIQGILSNNPARPVGLADKYSRLSTKEKLIVMVLFLTIRIEYEVKL
jgi:hypothetical protein